MLSVQLTLPTFPIKVAEGIREQSSSPSAAACWVLPRCWQYPWAPAWVFLFSHVVFSLVPAALLLFAHMRPSTPGKPSFTLELVSALKYPGYEVDGASELLLILPHCIHSPHSPVNTSSSADCAAKSIFLCIQYISMLIRRGDWCQVDPTAFVAARSCLTFGVDCYCDN